MQIGIQGGGRTVAEAVESVRRAEEAGFALAGFSNIFALDAMTVCAAAGLATERIELGTAVVPTFPRHPMVMAQQALSTHDACGGRFTLGIGLSHQIVIESMLGLDFSTPVGHAREYLQVIRALFDEGAVSHEGDHYTVNGTLDRPRDDRPDVLFAALGPQMLRVAGELAEGTVTWMCGERTIADHIAPSIAKAASEAGRQQPRVVCALPVCVTDDADAARERAASEFETYGMLPSYRAMLDREGAGGPADVSVVGDEGAVREALGRFRDAGATEFNGAVFGSDAERKATYELLAVCAREGV